MIIEKSLKLLVHEALEVTKPMNKYVKNAIEQLRKALQIELNALGKKIKEASFDFLREELSLAKRAINVYIEDLNSIIERDNILIQIADLENQIKIESIKEEDSIKNETLERLKIEERTLASNRRNRGWALQKKLSNLSINSKEFRVTLKLYADVFYEKFYLERDPNDKEEEFRWISYYDYFVDSIKLVLNLSPSPITFSLNDIKIQDAIKHAIRCKSAKVFQISIGNPIILIGAKSIEEAVEITADNYIYDAFFNEEEWLEYENIRGSPGGPYPSVFREANKDFIQKIKKRISPKVIEIK